MGINFLIIKNKMTDRYQKKYRHYTFQGKNKDEEIVLLLRRHWIRMIVFFLPVIFFLLGIIILWILTPLVIDLTAIDSGKQIFHLILSVLFLFWWLIVFITWVDYYLDVWIITTRRIINIEQIGLFRREVSELRHSRIQDVTTEVKGFFATLLKYGFVYVQTAGTKERFVFKNVPRPVFVRNIIMKLQKKAYLDRQIKEGQILRGKL